MPNIGDIVRASDFEAIKPQLSIGTVTTGAAGSNASASITGTSPNFKLNLTIPRGANGTNGQSGVLGTQVFTSSTTVTVPTGATKAVLSGCGAGGGSRGGTRGGWGGTVREYPVSVTAGQSIKITIGTGGAGSNTSNGSAGGATSFGSLLTLGGGGGATSISGGTQGTQGTAPTDNPGAYNGHWGRTVQSGQSGYGIGGLGGNPSYDAPGRGGNGLLIVTWAR